ncbi:MAG: AMP-binding protein [Actinomycetota bacterium]|nr:AMP-binding protein [Actinomycetota bacterium]
MRLLTGYSAADIDRYREAGHWTGATFGDLMRSHSASRPSAVAVTDGNRSLTWTQLAAEVDRVAGGLAGLDIREEERVSVQLTNCIELVVSILAIWEVGAIYQPLNPMYRRVELSSVMGLVRPAAVITSSAASGFDHPALIDEVADLLGSDPIRIVTGGTGEASRPGWIRYDDLAPPADAGDLPPGDTLRVALLGTTSGTTGDPKVYIHVQATQIFEARCLVDGLAIDGDDVVLAAAPITHRGALMVGLLTSISSGSELVLGDARDTQAISDLIESERVTMFMGIPTIVSDLLTLHEQGDCDHSSLRLVVVSGAPVTEELLGRFTTQWPDTLAATGYGLSETGWCTYLRVGDPLDKISSSGRLAPATEIQIRDPHDQPVQPGETGEIFIRGPMVCAGYFDNQVATEAAIDADGWFKSGDLGFLDDDGYIHPVGRSKHMIIRGGLNIYAEEIERLVEEHPDIEGAVVISVPDERLGERACACVVVRDGGEFDLGELRRFFDEAGVARYAWPERVEVLDELPRNPIGKIDRIAVSSLVLGRD